MIYLIVDIDCRINLTSITQVINKTFHCNSFIFEMFVSVQDKSCSRLFVAVDSQRVM